MLYQTLQETLFEDQAILTADVIARRDAHLMVAGFLVEAMAAWLEARTVKRMAGILIACSAAASKRSPNPMRRQSGATRG